MRIFKGLLKLLIGFLKIILIILIVIFLWHIISNYIFEKDLDIPGDMIEIYDNEHIHSVKMGKGKYTIVFLPGMGTASPYYDYYKLASEVSKTNQVIILEPFGYGYSDNTDKQRTLDNYEYELSKVLDYYGVENNIILLGHSYSGVSNLNYANKHKEVKGIVCLDCTTSYQIEKHVKDGKFIEEVPSISKIYTLLSSSGLVRLVYSTFMSNTIKNELLLDVPNEYIKDYKYLLYNKTMNKTIVNEYNDIYYNQLEIFGDKYRNDLYVLSILSDETIEEMKQYKNDGDFYHDWQEMHNLLISNKNIQKIYVLNGSHYIHHGNTEEINNKINEMISSIK